MKKLRKTLAVFLSASLVLATPAMEVTQAFAAGSIRKAGNHLTIDQLEKTQTARLSEGLREVGVAEGFMRASDLASQAGGATITSTRLLPLRFTRGRNDRTRSSHPGSLFREGLGLEISGEEGSLSEVKQLRLSGEASEELIEMAQLNVSPEYKLMAQEEAFYGLAPSLVAYD